MLYLWPGKVRPNADVDAVSPPMWKTSRLRFANSKTVLRLDLAPPGTYVNYSMTYLSVGDYETFDKDSLQLVDLVRQMGSMSLLTPNKMPFTISSCRRTYLSLLVLRKLESWRTSRDGLTTLLPTARALLSSQGIGSVFTSTWWSVEHWYTDIIPTTR